MAVIVRVPAVMRKHARGQERLEVEGDTLGAVLEHLRRDYPDLSSQLVNTERRVHGFVNIYVNDEDVRYSGGLDTPVPAGASISIVPAIAGG